MKVLLDGDILAYRAAFHAKDQSVETAVEKVDDLVEFILSQTLDFVVDNKYQVYLTGKGNFRYGIAKSHEYKGNRKDGVKPVHLEAVRLHLVDKWKAIVSEGEEADDLISKEAARLDYKVIVASIDKDMLQLPCKHFNFGRNEWYTVSEEEGLRFFYSQILTGDRSDNIVGLHRVGKVRANKILEGCHTEEEMYRAVVEAYGGDSTRVIENARLLWLRRKENELWQPPSLD